MARPETDLPEADLQRLAVEVDPAIPVDLGDSEVEFAPEPLCLELANTQYVHRGGIEDGIDTVHGLRRWLNELAPRMLTRLTADELQDVREADVLAANDLRGAVRALCTGVINGEVLDAEAAATVNRRVSLIPRWPELVVGEDGATSTRVRSTADGVPAAIAEVATDAVLLFADPQRRPAISACQAPGCINVFLRDQPERQWCSTRCGHRVRAATTGSLTLP